MKTEPEIKRRLALQKQAHEKDFGSLRLKKAYPQEYAFQKGCIAALKWVLAK